MTKMMKAIRTVPAMKTATFSSYLPKKARKTPRMMKAAPQNAL